jgi:hypothetical protein
MHDGLRQRRRRKQYAGAGRLEQGRSRSNGGRGGLARCFGALRGRRLVTMAHRGVMLVRREEEVPVIRGMTALQMLVAAGDPFQAGGRQSAEAKQHP